MTPYYYLQCRLRPHTAPCSLFSFTEWCEPPAVRTCESPTDAQLAASPARDEFPRQFGLERSPGSTSSPSDFGASSTMDQPVIGFPNRLSNMQKARLISLSLHSAARVASLLEANLLREEARQSVEHRKLGIRSAPRAPAEPSGLDMVAKTSISAIIRAQHLGLADIVRLYRHETSTDCRPNKALDPERMKFLLKGSRSRLMV